MPRPTSTSRVVIDGLLPGGEAFAWGFWTNAHAASQADAQAAAVGVAAEFVTHARTQLAFLLAADSSYQTVTFYSYINATGPADFTGQAAIAAGTGTGTGASLPLQLAHVTTLRTGLAGRRYRGRMYIPVNAMALANHQMTSSQNSATLQAIKDFLTAVNNRADVPGTISVVSQVVGEKQQITTVTADSRLDVQRRRAAGEAELFQASLAL